jgi:hypothetical protein
LSRKRRLATQQQTPLRPNRTGPCKDAKTTELDFQAGVFGRKAGHDTCAFAAAVRARASSRKQFVLHIFAQMATPVGRQAPPPVGSCDYSVACAEPSCNFPFGGRASDPEQRFRSTIRFAVAQKRRRFETSLG